MIELKHSKGNGRVSSGVEIRLPRGGRIWNYILGPLAYLSIFFMPTIDTKIPTSDTIFLDGNFDLDYGTSRFWNV